MTRLHVSPLRLLRQCAPLSSRGSMVGPWDPLTTLSRLFSLCLPVLVPMGGVFPPGLIVRPTPLSVCAGRPISAPVCAPLSCPPLSLRHGVPSTPFPPPPVLPCGLPQSAELQAVDAKRSNDRENSAGGSAPAYSWIAHQLHSGTTS